jgi:hypothetical protein
MTEQSYPFNFDLWANNFADRVTRIIYEGRNELAANNANLKDWMETRLDAQDRAISEARTELRQGIQEMRIGFETVVERQFIKEQKINALSVQIRDLVAQLGSGRAEPEVVLRLMEKTAQLQEAVAA